MSPEEREIEMRREAEMVAPGLSRVVREAEADSPFHGDLSVLASEAEGRSASAQQRTDGLGETHVEKMVRLSWSPSIVLLPGFISEELCDVRNPPSSLTWTLRFQLETLMLRMVRVASGAGRAGAAAADTVGGYLQRQRLPGLGEHLDPARAGRSNYVTDL